MSRPPSLVDNKIKVAGTSFSGASSQGQVASLQEKLEHKEEELSKLASWHQEAVKERDEMEGQLKAVKEKWREADSKLSEVKAESEAFIRQNESDQQELAMIRRRSLVGGGGQIITQMYETILMRYEKLKTSHEDLCLKMNEETEKRAKLQKQLNLSRMHNSGTENEPLARQQLTSEAVEALQRDLTRVREERTMIKREYSLVMSERDAVHKEIDKMQDDLTTMQKENKKLVAEKSQLLEEREKLKSQVINPRQGSAASLDVQAAHQELYVAQCERKQALLEKEAKVHEAYTAQKAHAVAMTMVEKLSLERDMLRSSEELAKQQLDETRQEAKAATRWRDIAFSERDKLRRELEESRRACDVMTAEREKLIKQLEEAAKEHDKIKEVKNKAVARLHEVQGRTSVSQLEACGNTQSHDSAIDSGEWESEPSSGGVFKRLRVVRVLPQHHDVTAEQGYFVKYSSARHVTSGDRILCVNDVPVGDKSLASINDLLAGSSPCMLQLVKHLPVSRCESNASSREEIMQTTGLPSSSSSSYTHKRHHDNNVWTGTDAQVRLRKKNMPFVTHGNGTGDIGMLKKPDKIQVKKIGNRHSTMLDSEEESQVSVFTAHSDPSHGGIKKVDPSQGSDALSSPRSDGKKKKPKIGSSRFLWNRKKKSKSLVVTSSTATNSGGTWPRLESPALSNVLASGGGRLSVFMKKRSRPSISSNTFTPPDGNSAGRTPPTLRGPISLSPAPAHSPRSLRTPPDASNQSTGEAPRPSGGPYTRSRRGTKKPRPLSAPMVDRSLSTWHPAANITPTTIAKTEEDSPVKQISPSLGVGPHKPKPHPQDARPITETYQSAQSSVAVTPLPTRSPVSPGRSAFRYSRQQSVPEQGKKLSLALSTCFASSLSSSSPTASRPRSAYSLPRPTSASQGPTFSLSSHDSHKTRKSKTLECKRIRIPSEASVGMMLSGSEKGSISLSSDRSTPILFHSSVDPPAGGGSTHRSTSQTDASMSSLSVASSTLSSRSRKPPVTNYPRYVTMIKGTEPIGISIVSGERGGIFVSRLTEHSLASQAGLEYGDQLLEYNGVNLRSAKEEQARVIMSQTQPGDNIKFLAHYNLEKYKHSIESNLSDTLGVSRPPPHSDVVLHEEKDGTITPDATPRASPHVEETLQSQRLNEPRYVFMSQGADHIKLVGGNSFGIYIASVEANDETLTHKPCDLKIGDRIIEYNSVRFDNITLEMASLMLLQPTSSASFQVAYEPNKFKQIYGLPGDHFYVRALFDHMVEREGALQFTRNSILLVDNTYPDYMSGQWTAALVDEQGGRSTGGRIPSKITVSKDSHQTDDSSSYAGSSSGKRLSGSGRRSFFKRKKPHRTSSRSSGDVRLHKSPSENSIESAAESACDALGAYQVVEKHASNIRRPVVIFGPHSALVVEKLTREHTQLFVRCCLDPMKGTGHGSAYIETYTQDMETRVLTADIVRNTMSQFPQRHVLLEVSVDAIDRLHLLKVYPIIAFIKYTSAKKIKESQDKSPAREKMSMKQCKEVLEKQNMIERALMSKYFGTVTINGGPASIVAGKVAKIVSHEHIKVLWLPAKTNLLSY